MAFKKTKWADIHKVLKERILTGEYPEGSAFPTNLEIGKEFDSHTSTIQLAVSELIREGLVLPPPSLAMRRTVRIKPKRSKRSTGFSGDHGKKATKKILDLRIITDHKDIPASFQDDIQAPTLFYHNEQYVDGLLVTVSRSYIPNHVPLQELQKLLDQDVPASLYGSFEQLGHKTTTGEESVIIDLATDEEKKELHLPGNLTIPIARIVRKVYDQNGHLIELCQLLSRGDCYEFQYKFEF